MIFGVSSGYRAQNGARGRKTETRLKVRHAFTGEHPQAVVSQLDKHTKTSPAGHGGAASQRVSEVVCIFLMSEIVPGPAGFRGSRSLETQSSYGSGNIADLVP